MLHKGTSAFTIMCLYGDKTIKDKDNNRAHSTKGVDADATLHIIQIKEHIFKLCKVWLEEGGPLGGHW